VFISDTRGGRKSLLAALTKNTLNNTHNCLLCQLLRCLAAKGFSSNWERLKKLSILYTVTILWSQKQKMGSTILAALMAHHTPTPSIGVSCNEQLVF
jgi:hypothetical protein